LEFETNVGDLASVLKVEKRKHSVVQEELRDQEAVGLVNRYKYKGLWPCTDMELKSMCHPVNGFSFVSTDQSQLIDSFFEGIYS
jgi:cleavage stimulation factor subunit 3